MSALGSGQNLGGAWVTLKLDDTQLKSGLAADKVLLQQFAQTPVLVQVGLDQASVNRVMGGLRGLSAPLLTLRAGFNTTQVRADFDRLLTELQNRTDLNPITLNVQGPGVGTGGAGGGGGRGFGGGGGGGGGRGGGVGPNYLSTRGIGRLIGNATAGFAIYAGMRVAGGLAEAEGISSHPERIQRGFQGEGGHDAMNDSIVAQQSQTIASLKAQQKAIESFTSVPLVGMAFKLVDSMAGLSDSLKDEEEAAQAATKAHLQIVETERQSAIYRATASGDAAGASQLIHQEVVDKQQLVTQKVYDDKNSSIAAKAEASQAYQDVIDDEQSKMRAEAQREEGRQINQNNRLYDLGDKRKASEAQTAGNDPLAMLYRQKLERRELYEQYVTKVAEIDPENKRDLDMAQKTFQAERGELGAKQEGERAQKEQQTQAKITSAVAAGASAQAKAAHDGYAAQMVEFEASANNRLAAIHDNGGRETQAVTQELAQQRAQMKKAHEEEEDNQEQSYKNRIQAAGLKAERKDFQAGLVVSVGEEQARIAALPTQFRQLAEQTLKAETQEKIRAHREEIAKQRTRLGVEEQTSRERANQQFLTANAHEEISASREATLYADPELRLQAEKTQKAKIDLDLRNLNPVGGGEARALGQHEYFGDITGRKAKDLAAAKADLKAEQDRLAKGIKADEAPQEGSGLGGNAVDKSNDLLQKMLTKFDTLINAYSAYALAGPPS